MSPTLPPSLQPQLIRLLQELIETITTLHEQVSSKLKAQAEKEAHLCDTSDDDDLDDDSDDDDDDDDYDNEDEGKKAAGKKKQGGDKEDDEDVDGAEETKDAMDDDQLGFVQKTTPAEGGDNSDDQFA